MSEVKRYIVATLPGRMTRDCVEVVKARDYDALKAENARLREALGDAREALFIIGCHPIKHDPQAYVVVRGIAETAIDKLDRDNIPTEDASAALPEGKL
jgi:hypothetical protein